MGYVEELLGSYELEDFLAQKTDNEFKQQVIAMYNNLNAATKNFTDYEFDVVYSEELNNLLELINEAEFKHGDIDLVDINAVKQIIEKCNEYLDGCNNAETIDGEVYMYTKQALELIEAEFVAKAEAVVSVESVEKTDKNIGGEER